MEKAYVLKWGEHYIAIDNFGGAYKTTLIHAAKWDSKGAALKYKSKFDDGVEWILQQFVCYATDCSEFIGNYCNYDQNNCVWGSACLYPNCDKNRVTDKKDLAV